MSDFPRAALVRAASAALLLSVFAPDCASGQSDQAHAAHMPEPMVFDLVRPLGAKRGELEINTLFQQSSQRGAPLAWAPEIEWAFRDGLAFEAELPFENGQLKTYKAALQGTLASGESGRFQHGWQIIAQRVRADDSFRGDALYLAGFRPTARTTLFTMTGARRSVFSGETAVQTLQNTTLFFQPSPGLILGVETNWVLGSADRRERLIMPQVQMAVGNRYLMEFGVGAEERSPGRWGAAFGARLVLELH